MPKIEDLFEPHTAKSSGFSAHAPGEIAFVTNGFGNNGVVGFVKSKPEDRVFTIVGIALSAFCEATVQMPPFIARGNGGSGLIVLVPRQPMSVERLAHIASYINTTIRWRFNWYRQATVDRIRQLDIPPLQGKPIKFPIRDLLPPVGVIGTPFVGRLNLKPFLVGELFELTAGDFHATGELPEGNIPLISCGDANNGITAFVDVPDSKAYERKLTIAFNGMNALTTKYHPYKFAAKDDVAVCTPIAPLRGTTIFFIQLMLAREKWRYNYYRKCFADKLKRQSLMLPVKAGAVDEEAIEQLVQSSPYWLHIASSFKGNPLPK
jgi:hypothetical protein